LIAVKIMRPIRLSALSLALALFHLAPGAGTASASDRKDYDREIARQRRELDDLRSRLQNEQKELENLKEKKESTLGRLEKISGNIQLAERYLSQLDATEETLNRSLATVKQDLDEVEARIQDRNGVMSRRVRTLYMSGGPDRMILEGWKAGHGDFMRKVFFMKRVIRYDKSLVTASEEDAGLKRKTLAKLDSRIGELTQFRDHKAKERETFTRAKKEQEKNLASITSDETTKREALQEMEENARLINEIIAALEKRRQDELARNKKASELEKGSKYCLPVEGDVVSKYGLQYHATLKTTTKNLGIEIRGKSGTAVRAAVSGEVALITRIPGYGMGVILDNGSMPTWPASRCVRATRSKPARISPPSRWKRAASISRSAKGPRPWIRRNG
jgi:peptidoglycan hydrolase CwlO-like protein